jgi:hypothetical protein
MAWYAYCLTEHQTLANGVRARRPYVIEGIQGVGGAPVMSYPSGEFAVIVSEFDRATTKLEEKSVLEHARVVAMSFRTATVLPFRFGTIFDTEDGIRQAVRYRGAMEEIILPDTVGREYLAKLREKASRDRERQTKARAISVQVHKLFNPLEEEVSCKKVNADGMLLDIAHLIDTKHIEKYQNRYSTAAKQLKNCELVVTGPWPPYHFLPEKLRTVAGNS